MRSVLPAAARDSLPVSVASRGDGVDAPSSTRAVGSGAAVAEWNELVSRNETNAVFQTYQWFDAWWRTFGDAHAKRPLNWFSSRREVRFRNVASLDEIKDWLPVFFEQHAERWHAAGRPSLFDTERQRAFYLAFAAELLTRKIIEDGLQRSKRELDFTIGAEAFEDRFAHISRFNVKLSVYHSAASALRARGWRWLRRNLGRVRRKIFAARTVAPASKIPTSLPESHQ